VIDVGAARDEQHDDIGAAGRRGRSQERRAVDTAEDRTAAAWTLREALDAVLYAPRAPPRARARRAVVRGELAAGGQWIKLSPNSARLAARQYDAIEEGLPRCVSMRKFDDALPMASLSLRLRCAPHQALPDSSGSTVPSAVSFAVR